MRFDPRIRRLLEIVARVSGEQERKDAVQLLTSLQTDFNDLAKMLQTCNKSIDKN